MTASDSAYPAHYPHGPVTPIGDDVFMVRGSVQMKPLFRITRNMAIVRHDGVLTLVNPIRLSADGERELTALGTVGNIVRLGAFHGMDDRYYVERLGAKLWCQPGGKSYAQPPIDIEIRDDTQLPFSDGEIFSFDGTRQPECALLVKRGKGILLTCDAIQHYGDYKYNNLLARIAMPFLGFPKTTLVGPIWLKYMAREGESLQPVFEKILDLDFDGLLSAHGSYLERDAKVRVRAAIDRAFTPD